MEIAFTGTNAAIPNEYRNPSGLLVRLDQKPLILVDCGEGTQRRIIDLAIKRFSMNRIEVILITHMHMDHYYGIVPLIRTLAMHRRAKDLHIVGPQGIMDHIERGLAIGDYSIDFRIYFHELCDEKVEDGNCHFSMTGGHKSVNYVYDFSKKNSRRRISRFSGFNLMAYRLVHGDIPSYAYGVFKDKDESANLFFGDCRIGEAHKEIIKRYEGNVNCVVHECTFSNALIEKPSCKGHSTTKMVVDFFKKLKPKNAFVTHFSSRYHPKGSKKKCNLGIIEEELKKFPITMAEELKVYSMQS